MAGTMFAEKIGTKLVHVPYKGSAPALTDLVGGRVTMMFDHIPSVLPQIKGGKLNALATSGKKRDAALPNLPTMAEAGVPGFETSVWFGLTVPAGTPRPIIARLNAEAVKAARAPAFVKTMGGLGYEIVVSTPEEMAAMLKEEIELWGPVVKASGARVD
jgi:tripartite-type tricarboxylate transporter receptor subunit TctC